MLATEAFQELLAPAQSFGLRDRRVWTYRIEVRCYHMVLFENVRALRREIRNTTAAKHFIKERSQRKRRIHFSLWTHYVARRGRCRWLLVQMVRARAT